MSLVFTLAMRNLFQDRLRFIASLMGIVFSVVLVMVQTGLYFGFSGMITTMRPPPEDRRSVQSRSRSGWIFRLAPAGWSHDFGIRRRN
jgi:hypothetical protein